MREGHAVLETVVNWGPMDGKVVKGKIRFEKGSENEVNRYEIDKVWIQFRGLPKEFKEFPIIWAVGTILGVPRAVDTVFTKNTGRPRLKVAVLDPKLIPTFVDLVIGDFVYELQFRVEEESPTGEPFLIDMDKNHDEEPKEDDPKEGDATKKMDVDAEPSGAQAPNSGNNLPAGGDQGKQVPGAEHQVPVDTTSIFQSTYIGSQSIAEMSNRKPAVVLSQSAGAPNGWKATLVPNQLDSGILKNTKISGTVSPVRSSKRSAAKGDQDSIEKAAKLKAKRNLESPVDKGSVPGNALASSLGNVAAA